MWTGKNAVEAIVGYIRRRCEWSAPHLAALRLHYSPVEACGIEYNVLELATNEKGVKVA
jgi:hypothetical protein